MVYMNSYVRGRWLRVEARRRILNIASKKERVRDEMRTGQPVYYVYCIYHVMHLSCVIMVIAAGWLVSEASDC
jgi:hypothetical protein